MLKKKRMSAPIRKYYIFTWFLPSVKKLKSLISRQRHLVLAFPAWISESTKNDLIRSLQKKMPENYSVFNAASRKYWSYVTIMQVISAPEVDTLIPEIQHAARTFKVQAEYLAREIATLNHVPLTELWENTEKITQFPKDWKCYHHGQHYCCRNMKSGQVVELPIWYEEEFGVLDPYFLSRFIETTPSLDMPVNIIDKYHDMSRVLEIMLKKGLLKQIQGEKFKVFGITIT
jgi:hypothetical protein